MRLQPPMTEQLILQSFIHQLTFGASQMLNLPLITVCRTVFHHVAWLVLCMVDRPGHTFKVPGVFYWMSPARNPTQHVYSYLVQFYTTNFCL